MNENLETRFHSFRLVTCDAHRTVIEGVDQAEAETKISLLFVARRSLTHRGASNRREECRRSFSPVEAKDSAALD